MGIATTRTCRIEGLEGRRLLAAVSWDGGGGDGKWSNPLNWSGDAVPGSSDDVTTVSSSPTIQVDVAAAVHSLTVASGTVYITRALDIGGDLRVKSGASAGLPPGGSVTGTGKITVEAGGTWLPIQWSNTAFGAGDIYVPVDNDGTMNLAGGANIGPAFHNYAKTTAWKSVGGPNLYGSFDNEAGASLILRSYPIVPGTAAFGLDRSPSGVITTSSFVNDGSVVIVNFGPDSGSTGESYYAGFSLTIYCDSVPSLGGTWNTSGGPFTLTTYGSTRATTTLDPTFELTQGSIIVNNANVGVRGLNAGNGLRVYNGTIAPLTSRLDVKILQILDGGRLNLGTGGRTLRAADVGIAATGTLDLGDGTFIDGNQPFYGTNVIPQQNTPPATSPAYLDALRATVGGQTLTVRADNAASTSPTGGVGWAKGSTLLGGAASGAFSGEAIDANDFVFRATLRGDTDLDRDVDFNDLLALAKNYNTTGKSFGEGNGDGSSDGSVNFSDLLMLAKNYSKTFVLPPAAVFAEANSQPTRRTRVSVVV